MAVVGLTNLCGPAKFYLIISLAAVLFMAFQNIISGNNYCVGTQSCSSVDPKLLFVIKLVYVAFWTWLLNIICDRISPAVSWVLVMIPILIMFIFISITFVGSYDWKMMVPSVSLLN